MSKKKPANDSAPELVALRIGELSRATGKSARALRLYEEMGLLSPGERSAGGFRLYDASAVDRVQWITQLQDLGFSLADVQALVGGAAQAPLPREAMASVKARFVEKRDAVKKQIARLKQLQAELDAAVAYLDACGVCTVDAEGPTACLSCNEHTPDPPPPLVDGVQRTADNFPDSSRTQEIGA